VNPQILKKNKKTKSREPTEKLVLFFTGKRTFVFEICISNYEYARLIQKVGFYFVLLEKHRFRSGFSLYNERESNSFSIGSSIFLRIYTNPHPYNQGTGMIAIRNLD